jgi:hypothetical protein
VRNLKHFDILLQARQGANEACFLSDMSGVAEALTAQGKADENTKALLDAVRGYEELMDELKPLAENIQTAFDKGDEQTIKQAEVFEYKVNSLLGVAFQQAEIVFKNRASGFYLNPYRVKQARPKGRLLN